MLAIQLSKHPLVEVTLFVLQCSEEEKREALSHNINVIQAARQPGLDEHIWLCFPPNHLEIDIVIGHGALLGAQATRQDFMTLLYLEIDLENCDIIN